MSREFKLDTTAFMQTAARFLANSKRDALAVLKDQAKGVLKEVIAITPPGSANVSPGKARSRGAARVKADILKVVRGVKPERAEETRIHPLVQARRIRGRVPVAVEPRVTVPAELLKTYLKARQQRVGFLASGWNVAAAKLGFKPPPWVWRHQAPGAVAIRVTDKDIVIRATNQVRYASQISNLRNRLQQALNMQRNKMERQLKAFFERAGKQAGFR
jgi:hypothetical protein